MFIYEGYNFNITKDTKIVMEVEGQEQVYANIKLITKVGNRIEPILMGENSATIFFTKDDIFTITKKRNIIPRRKF